MTHVMARPTRQGSIRMKWLLLPAPLVGRIGGWYLTPEAPTDDSATNSTNSRGTPITIKALVPTTVSSPIPIPKMGESQRPIQSGRSNSQRLPAEKEATTQNQAKKLANGTPKY